MKMDGRIGKRYDEVDGEVKGVGRERGKGD